MPYDLMLLADPGTERPRVLAALAAAPDIRPDGQVENRFRLTTPHGEATINIGTKDPVESVHLEFEMGVLPLADAAAARALELAQALDMSVEDVQWGHEVTADNVTRLREHWRRSQRRSRPVAPPADAARPWWRFW